MIAFAFFRISSIIVSFYGFHIIYDIQDFGLGMEKGGGMITCLLFALFCPRVRSIVKHKSLEGDSHREHISHPDTPCHQLDDKKREGEPPLRVGGGG